MSAANNLHPFRQDAAEKSSSSAPALPALPNLSRSEALELGALVDVTELARRDGFLVPVAVSRNLWDDLGAVPDAERGINHNEAVAGRLADVLFMARRAVAGEPILRVREVSFSLKLVTRGNEPDEVYGGCDDYAVRLVSQEGDRGEPVLTLFRQGEPGEQRER